MGTSLSEHKKTLFYCKVVRRWNVMSREVIESQYMDIHKTPGHRAPVDPVLSREVCAFHLLFQVNEGLTVTLPIK